MYITLINIYFEFHTHRIDWLFSLTNINDLFFNEKHNNFKNHQFYRCGFVYYLWCDVGNFLANYYYKYIYFVCKFLLLNEAFPKILDFKFNFEPFFLFLTIINLIEHKKVIIFFLNIEL